MNNEEVLTSKQVARLLNIQPRAVTRYVQLGKLSAISGLGKGYKFLKSSLLEDLKKLENKVANKYIEP